VGSNPRKHPKNLIYIVVSESVACLKDEYDQSGSSYNCPINVKGSND